MEKLHLHKIFLQLFTSEIDSLGKTIDRPILLNCSKFRIIDCENCYIDKRHKNWFKSMQKLHLVGDSAIDEITVTSLTSQGEIEETTYYFDVTASFET